MTYKVYPSLTIFLSLTFSYAAFGSNQVFSNEDEIKKTTPAALPVIEKPLDESLRASLHQDTSTPRAISAPSPRSHTVICVEWEYTQYGSEPHYVLNTCTGSLHRKKPGFKDVMALR